MVDDDGDELLLVAGLFGEVIGRLCIMLEFDSAGKGNGKCTED